MINLLKDAKKEASGITKIPETNTIFVTFSIFASRETGVKRIRIHDLKHSHVAHLIKLGFSPMEIADGFGHESRAKPFIPLYIIGGGVKANLWI